MFFWVVWNAGKLRSGTEDQVRTIYGTTTAVYARRLILFYFPSGRYENEVHAGRFVSGWKHRRRPPAIKTMFDYASSLIMHMTEALIEHPESLEVPSGDWLAALAPYHNEWLRQVDPDDLHKAWNGNKVCFSVASSAVEPVQVDGGSKFQRNRVGLHFETLGGVAVPDPPAFIRAVTGRRTALWMPGDP
jgi:hypothetical protein